MHNILNEFDPNPSAVINPWKNVPSIPEFPEICIGAFSAPIVEKFVAKHQAEILLNMECANGSTPVYRFVYKDVPVAFYMCAVGAPLCISEMEDMIALGAKKLVYFGSCGVLNHEIADGHIIVPTSAVRDEGTSYHYAPPTEEIALDEQSVRAMVETLEELNYPYVTGKVWTTDAFYRETAEKMARRKAAGCIAVDMECSALTAAARFRGAKFAQFVYAADCLSGEEWDARNLGDQGLSESDRYMTLALECALRL